MHEHLKDHKPHNLKVHFVCNTALRCDEGKTFMQKSFKQLVKMLLFD